ncbi:hypothetical protein JCM5350_007936 [Sporobolomyces pararoseus]
MLLKTRHWTTHDEEDLESIVQLLEPEMKKYGVDPYEVLTLLLSETCSSCDHNARILGINLQLMMALCQRCIELRLVPHPLLNLSPLNPMNRVQWKSYCDKITSRYTYNYICVPSPQPPPRLEVSAAAEQDSQARYQLIWSAVKFDLPFDRLDVVGPGKEMVRLWKESFERHNNETTIAKQAYRLLEDKGLAGLHQTILSLFSIKHAPEFVELSQANSLLESIDERASSFSLQLEGVYKSALEWFPLHTLVLPLSILSTEPIFEYLSTLPYPNTCALFLDLCSAILELDPGLFDILSTDTIFDRFVRSAPVQSSTTIDNPLLEWLNSTSRVERIHYEQEMNRLISRYPLESHLTPWSSELSTFQLFGCNFCTEVGTPSEILSHYLRLHQFELPQSNHENVYHFQFKRFHRFLQQVFVSNLSLVKSSRTLRPV